MAVFQCVNTIDFYVRLLSLKAGQADYSSVAGCDEYFFHTLFKAAYLKLHYKLACLAAPLLLEVESNEMNGYGSVSAPAEIYWRPDAM